jgi:hypothetical protein
VKGLRLLTRGWRYIFVEMQALLCVLNEAEERSGWLFININSWLDKYKQSVTINNYQSTTEPVWNVGYQHQRPLVRWTTCSTTQLATEEISIIYLLKDFNANTNFFYHVTYLSSAGKMALLSELHALMEIFLGCWLNLSRKMHSNVWQNNILVLLKSRTS